MQYIKARKDLVFIVNPIVFITGLFIFWHYAHWIPSLFHIFWATLAIVLLLIITPLGSRHLSQNHDDIAKRIQPLSWIARIILLELSMTGTFGGIAYVAGTLFPISHHIETGLFTTTMTEVMRNGLFPWPLYAVIAVSMAALAYRKQEHAFFSTLLKPINRQTPKETWSLITNIGVRRCTLFAIAITLMFFTLLLLGSAISDLLPLNDGFQTPALLTTLVLLLFASSKMAKNYLRRFFTRKIPTSLGFPTFCILLGLSIFLLNIITTGLMQPSTHAAKIPTIIDQLLQKNWHTYWLIFTNMWWLAFTPIITSYIANISKGYRVRQVLLGVLALPILVTLIFYIGQHNTWSFHISPAQIKILTIVSCLIFLPQVINHKYSPNIILSYLPKNGIVKAKDEQPFFDRVVILTVLGFYFFFVLGINGLSLFFFSLIYLYTMTFFIIGFLTFWHLRKSRDN